MDEPEDQESKFKFRDLKTLGSTFWLLNVSYAFTLIIVWESVNISSKVYQLKYRFAENEVGFLNDITYIVAAVLNPLIGIFVDKYAKNKKLLLILSGSLLIMVINLMQLLLPDCHKCYYSTIPDVLLGISYSISSVILYPLIALIVQKNIVGTAYGIVSVSANISYAIISPAIGTIQDNTGE